MAEETKILIYQTEIVKYCRFAPFVKEINKLYESMSDEEKGRASVSITDNKFINIYLHQRQDGLGVHVRWFDRPPLGPRG